MAWSYRPERPFLVNSTNQHTKMGLDNPDTVYYHANVRPDATYVVRGVRGATADLSFQVLGGDYTPSSTPDGSTAFDDRDLTIAADGSFELSLGPAGSPHARAHHVVLPESAAMLAIREVYDDWGVARGSLTLHRADTLGTSPAAPPTREAVEKRYAVAAKMLLGRIRTWFAFPEWFYLNEPVNTLTVPRPTPGGLSSQWSSVGHYDLADDEALVLTVPRGTAPYLGFQLGTVWYTSLEYADHQTSLNGHQAQVDPDGMIRIVVGRADPGRPQLGGAAGPRPRLPAVPLAAPRRPAVRGRRTDAAEGRHSTTWPAVLPHHDHNRVTPDEWAARIAARQLGVAGRMLS